MVQVLRQRAIAALLPGELRGRHSADDAVPKGDADLTSPRFPGWPASTASAPAEVRGAGALMPAGPAEARLVAPSDSL
jgi:hypothetical protein